MVGCNSKLKADNRECAVFEAAKVKARQEKKKAAHCFKSYFLFVVVLRL